HATIAGVHAMIEAGGPAADEQANPTIHIETRAGTLTAFVERHPGTALGCMIWLELIKPTFTRSPLSPVDLAAPLNLTADGFDPALPMVKTQDQDLLVFVENVVTLNNARPDSARLGNLLVGAGLRGLCLATVNTFSPSVHVQSRFFCPQLGVDEDPVTGSVHGPLAVYLVNHGVVEVHEGLAGLMCVQGKAGGRAGGGGRGNGAGRAATALQPALRMERARRRRRVPPRRIPVDRLRQGQPGRCGGAQGPGRERHSHHRADPVGAGHGAPPDDRGGRQSRDQTGRVRVDPRIPPAADAAADDHRNQGAA
ncbi:MAG: PhzF family phenazine biosynthesis protein, partial [Proteobacteria bacterium]|nr:PhzF family phenazine biosynthesis protein [Pseudomonadota bacterium]